MTLNLPTYNNAKMSQEIFSSLCIILIIWTSQISHVLTTTTQNELSSQQETIPNDQLTNFQLRQLLEILDAPSDSKEAIKFESHPLLHLGELLLDDDNESFSSTTTSNPIITTTTLPPTSQVSRREDINNPVDPPAVSHDQLVQQLSLFNSLLMSLSVENTTTETPTEGPPPPMNEKQIALLQSLFGNFNPIQTTEASQFLKRQTESSASSPGAAGESAQNPSPSSPDIAALSELLTQISKAPTDANGNLNLQSILGGTTSGGANIPDHLKNFQNNNANMDAAAATNQLSTLLSLLGTLGSLTQVQQQQQPSPSLFNFGATPGLLNQPQAQSSQQAPNIFGNLFNQQQPQAQQQQPFNFGGLGSVISTMSNILGGTGVGGKPRVRGKGVDTRLGLGYRFGDAADAQIMWDIGPQLFTEPIQNEPERYQMTKKKRHDSSSSQPHPPQNIQVQAQAEKEQQQIAASRRYYNHHPSSKQYSSRRNFFINPPTTRKPSIKNLTPYAQEQALKELWQMMVMKKKLEQLQSQSQSQYQNRNIPNSNYLNNFSPAELYQMQRQKHVIKRASSIKPDELNLNPTHPTHVSNDENNEPIQGAESFLRFRKIPPTSSINKNGHPHPSFSQQQPPSRNSQSNGGPGGLFNLNIFGRFRGSRPPPSSSSTGNRQPHPHQNAPPPPPMMDLQHGSPSQLGRWDMENHRFDNFKNTNGELVMTDSNSNDRFYVRNKNNNNANNMNSRNSEFVGA